MPNPTFSLHESFPRAKASFLADGSVWKLQVPQGTFAKFRLVNGQGLVAASNNPGVVPNSAAAFSGATGMEPKREIEIFGLSRGVSLIECRQNGAGPSVVTMQIEVVPTAGRHEFRVAFSASAAALNAPDVQVKYDLAKKTTVTGGPPEKLFDTVPDGTKHVVLNCHGQMAGTPPQLTLFIGGNITQGNVSAVFAPLKAKSSGGVIWIGGCEAGSDNDFCKQAVLASGCFLVAPAITLPTVAHLKPGQIDWFGDSMVKFFDSVTGAPMKQGDFLLKQRALGFALIHA